MADSPTKGAESLASAGLPSSDDGGPAVVERAWSCQLGTEQRELKGEDRFASRRLYATPEDMEASVHSVHSTQGNSRQVVVGQEDIIVVLVADGHGGRQASQYCRDHLLDYWVEQAADDPCSESLLKASEASCERVHREIKGFTTAGSTITIVALNLVRGELSVANLGDSEAWLVPRGAGAPIRLTEERRPGSNADPRVPASTREGADSAVLPGIPLPRYLLRRVERRHGARDCTHRPRLWRVFGVGPPPRLVRAGAGARARYGRPDRPRQEPQRQTRARPRAEPSPNLLGSLPEAHIRRPRRPAPPLAGRHRPGDDTS